MLQTELLIGDAAPALRLAEFIKGEAFDSFAPQTVYVMEFWATWCDPCKRAIPHMTALQRRYPEAVVLGIAVAWKSVDEVRDFVAAQGDAMDYRVALDLPVVEIKRNWTRTAWCDAAYQVGIPTSFIVDQFGRVAWMGHPTELDAPLEAVLGNKFDLSAHIMDHTRWLDNENVRESWILKRALEQHCLAGDKAGMLSLYAETLNRYPKLVVEHGLNRLKLMLELCPEQAVVLFNDLLHGSWVDEANLLYSAAILLTTHAELLRDDRADVSSADAAKLACQALERVEQSLCGLDGAAALKFHMLQARAHLACDDRVGAHGHALAAYELSKRLPLGTDLQEPASSVLQRCQQALNE